MLLSCAQQRSATVELITGRTMGTTYHIKYVVDDGGALPAKSHLHAGVEAILAAIDKQMSTYRPDSELSRFNASRSSDWFAASADLVKVLQEARRVSELSKGLSMLLSVRSWSCGDSVRMPVHSEFLRQPHCRRPGRRLDFAILSCG
jgi:thiamine biosynthesis lipoprotein ApbE